MVAQQLAVEHDIAVLVTALEEHLCPLAARRRGAGEVLAVDPYSCTTREWIEGLGVGERHGGRR